MCTTIPTRKRYALLGNLTLKSSYEGNDLVYYLEERVNERPAFLPYYYHVPSLNIHLNLVREMNNEVFEFGGLHGEDPICGYLSYNSNSVQVTFTKLSNQRVLSVFTDPTATGLQIA